MILSAGLTPAWQQILVFDRFRWGEVNRAREVHWCGSGKVLNAGIAVSHLCPHGEGLTLAALGGPALQQIDREFEQLAIPRRWIVTQSPTRVCTTILNRGDGTITELVENGRPLLPEELDAFLAAYAEEAARAEVAILIGSLPAGAPRSFYRELLEQTPCPAVLDFRGEELLDLLNLRPLVVKPNREELGHTFGRPLNNDAEMLDAMRDLNRRGAQWVVVTQGAGPVWITSHDQTWRADPQSVDEVVNPIGSGDALAAGIAWGVYRGLAVVEAVRLGIAAAQDNLRQLLPCRLDPRWIEARAAEVGMRRVESA